MLGRKRPTLNRMGVQAAGWLEDPHGRMLALSARLRRVVVCCGDWTRVVTPACLRKGKAAGIFLDPPYDHSTGRDARIYTYEMVSTAAVGDFCRCHGTDPSIRIVLAGMEGEYRLPGWTVVPWMRPPTTNAHAVGQANARRERLWLSPHCQQTPAIRSATRDFRRRVANLGGRPASPGRSKIKTDPNRRPSTGRRPARQKIDPGDRRR